MITLTPRRQYLRTAALYLFAARTLVPGTSLAALPDMQTSSRGICIDLVQLLQNQGPELLMRIALAIAIAAFCGATYHACNAYIDLRNGRRSRGRLGLGCVIATLLLVVIGLLLKGAKVL